LENELPQKIEGMTPAGIKRFAEMRKGAPTPPKPLPGKAPENIGLPTVNEPGASEHPIWVVTPRKAYKPSHPFGAALPPAKPVRRSKPRTFLAKYEGTCVNCHGPIAAGMRITSSKSHGYVHSGGCPKK
jgi:hypothetical protein